MFQGFSGQQQLIFSDFQDHKRGLYKNIKDFQEENVN